MPFSERPGPAKLRRKSPVPAPRLLSDDERYRILSELTTDYAFSLSVETDGTLRVDWVSEGFRRLTGLPPTEAGESEAWKRVVHPGDLPLVTTHLERLAAGKPDDVEFRLGSVGEEIRW